MLIRELNILYMVITDQQCITLSKKKSNSLTIENDNLKSDHMTRHVHRKSFDKQLLNQNQKF